MGIQTEYNTDLALRNYQEYSRGNRMSSECLPNCLGEKTTYEFLKKGQRIYCLTEEIPLVETKGDQQLSKPLASIVILESTHFLRGKKPYTKGKYLVTEVFDPNDSTIHFNSCTKVKK